MKTTVILLTAAITLAAATVTTRAQSGYDLFQKALAAERADGNLSEAIRLYQQVVKQAAGDRALVARALVRIAVCYETLGSPDARAIYQRVVREFGDSDAAAEARVRLGTLADAGTPTSVMARLVWAGADALGSVRGTISPDGRYLTYLDTPTGGLGLRDLRSGASRILAQESGSTMFYAVFSADGRRVAYSWNVRQGSDLEVDLRVIALDAGAKPTVVYRNPETLQLRPFGWSSDGRHVLALRSLRDGTNQITLIRVDTGAATVLKSVPWNYTAMSLSPDGRYVAFEQTTGTATAPTEIFVIATDGSRETRVVDGPAINSSPIWSPDGARVLFLSERTGTMSLWAVPVRDGRATGAPQLVKADVGRVRLQGLTRNGVLHYLSLGISRANVYLGGMNPSGMATDTPAILADRFLNSNSAPTWSPSGASLAYLSARGPAGTVLVVRDVVSGAERDIPLPREVQTGNLAPAPRWFPDGGSVLVFGFLPNGRGRYYRVDVTRGTVDVVHEASGVSGNGGLGASVISKDGHAILYIASATSAFQGKTNLIHFDLNTKQETILTSGTFNTIAISPDGARVALHTNDGTPGGCYIESMPVSGGELRRAVRACIGVHRLAWISNDDLLYVTGGTTTPNVVWRVAAAGGEPVAVGISMPGQLNHPEISPDKRRVAFAVFDTAASEVWALENFLPGPSTNR